MKRRKKKGKGKGEDKGSKEKEKEDKEDEEAVEAARKEKDEKVKKIFLFFSPARVPVTQKHIYTSHESLINTFINTNIFPIHLDQSPHHCRFHSPIIHDHDDHQRHRPHPSNLHSTKVSPPVPPFFLPSSSSSFPPFFFFFFFPHLLINPPPVKPKIPNRIFHQKRIDRIRAAELAKRNRERFRNPEALFPKVPRGDLDG